MVPISYFKGDAASSDKTFPAFCHTVEPVALLAGSKIIGRLNFLIVSLTNAHNKRE